MDHELRTLRDRHEDLEDAIDRADRTPPDSGRSLLVQTTTVGTYPGNPLSFFAVVEVAASGVEAEGETPTFTPVDPSNVFYAANLGGQVPPPGTVLKARMVGSKWCMRYG